LSWQAIQRKFPTALRIDESEEKTKTTTPPIALIPAQWGGGGELALDKRHLGYTATEEHPLLVLCNSAVSGLQTPMPTWRRRAAEIGMKLKGSINLYLLGRVLINEALIVSLPGDVCFTPDSRRAASPPQRVRYVPRADILGDGLDVG